MATTLVGHFFDAEDARLTVRTLKNIGIPATDVSSSTMQVDTNETFGLEGRRPLFQLMGEFLIIGGVLGGLVGFLAGSGFLATASNGLVPPGGNMFTTMAGTLLGTGAGAIIWGLVGGVIGAILSAINILVARPRRTTTRVSVNVPAERAARAQAIMEQYGAAEIEGGVGAH